MDYALFTGDCVDVMNNMPEKSVHVVVTSPPYNIGVKYRQYFDTRPDSLYIQWTRDWMKAVRRVLHDDGSVFLNLGSSLNNPLLPLRVINAVTFDEVGGLVLQNTIHWIKSITVQNPHGNYLSVGHFKPINSGRYLNDCHEYIFHLTKNGRVKLDRLAVGVPYQDKSNVKRWEHTGGRDCRCRGNNWYIPYETRNYTQDHPATFPSMLPEMCIRLHGVKHRDQSFLHVMDPFSGLGNTGAAAVRCDAAKFTGIDVDAEYNKLAREVIDGELALQNL